MPQMASPGFCQDRASSALVPPVDLLDEPVRPSHEIVGHRLPAGLDMNHMATAGINRRYHPEAPGNPVRHPRNDGAVLCAGPYEYWTREIRDAYLRRPYRGLCRYAPRHWHLPRMKSGRLGVIEM